MPWRHEVERLGEELLQALRRAEDEKVVELAATAAALTGASPPG
jgi:hypothetical protein